MSNFHGMVRSLVARLAVLLVLLALVFWRIKALRIGTSNKLLQRGSKWRGKKGCRILLISGKLLI